MEVFILQERKGQHANILSRLRDVPKSTECRLVRCCQSGHCCVSYCASSCSSCSSFWRTGQYDFVQSVPS